ncbi:protein serine/threonine phosphatase 2C, partial [Ramicandelaber brevisporus]
KQQDEVIAIQDIFNNGGSHALCGVFDGHGVEGHRVAAFVKRRLPMEVSRRFADFESDPIQAFTRVFASTNAALRARRSGPIDIYMSGTTATVALISATQVLVANLGDSRAILIQRPTQLTELPGNSGADTTQITTDHTCECEPERARVEQSGARVDYQREPSRSLPTPSAHTIDGPLRIYNGSLPYPGLVVTRAFGDSSALRLGVISEPEVRCYTLNPARDVGLVLATDGVWDVLQNQHVAHIYSSHPGNMAKVSKLITKVSLKMQQRAQLADNTTVV